MSGYFARNIPGSSHLLQQRCLKNKNDVCNWSTVWGKTTSHLTFKTKRISLRFLLSVVLPRIRWKKDERQIIRERFLLPQDLLSSYWGTTWSTHIFTSHISLWQKKPGQNSSIETIIRDFNKLIPGRFNFMNMKTIVNMKRLELFKKNEKNKGI